MKVVVREIGSRPVISTPARLNAPQGAKALADLLADKDFADLCVLNIDWDGDGFTPVLMVVAVKWFIEYGGQRLEMEWPIDIDEAFGRDNMNNGILRDIVLHMEEEFHAKTDARRRRDN